MGAVVSLRRNPLEEFITVNLRLGLGMVTKEADMFLLSLARNKALSRILLCFGSH